MVLYFNCFTWCEAGCESPKKWDLSCVLAVMQRRWVSLLWCLPRGMIHTRLVQARARGWLMKWLINRWEQWVLGWPMKWLINRWEQWVRAWIKRSSTFFRAYRLIYWMLRAVANSVIWVRLDASLVDVLMPGRKLPFSNKYAWPDTRSILFRDCM
jgi:hypothetical protein